MTKFCSVGFCFPVENYYSTVIGLKHLNITLESILNSDHRSDELVVEWCRTLIQKNQKRQEITREDIKFPLDMHSVMFREFRDCDRYVDIVYDSRESLIRVMYAENFEGKHPHDMDACIEIEQFIASRQGSLHFIAYQCGYRGQSASPVIMVWQK